MKFLYFKLVGFRFDGSFGGKYANVFCMRHIAYHFGGRTDDTEYTSVWCILRQLLLLNGPKGFRGSGVSAQNDVWTTHLEEFLDGLEGKFVYYIKRARTIGGTRIVAKIDVVVLWHTLTDAVKYGQAAVA